MTIEQLQEFFSAKSIGFTFTKETPITAGDCSTPALVGQDNYIAKSHIFPTAFIQAIGPADALVQISGHATLGPNAEHNNVAMMVVTATAKQISDTAAHWIGEVFETVKFNKDLTKRRTFGDVRCTINYIALNGAGQFSFTAIL